MISLRIHVDSMLEELREHVLRKPDVYAFILLDLERYRHVTEFIIAEREGVIEGFVVMFRGGVLMSVIIDGTHEAVEFLVEKFSKMLRKPAIINVPREYEDKVLKVLKNVVAVYSVDVMSVRKGEERLIIKHPYREVVEGDYKQLANLLGERRARRVIASYRPVFGIFVNSQLVSTAATLVKLKEVWMLGAVYTHPEYRNRGFATSVCSAWLKHAFENTNIATLWVRSDNLPAKRVYEKLGFKTVRVNSWICVEVDKKP
ncbi:MAG: hypothetical protein DRJ59_03915 [Thermoprotei archaeon]|nr:MAG: hypothetical protein DRJ59_03915 [Thermoprotei archaeon]